MAVEIVKPQKTPNYLGWEERVYPTSTEFRLQVQPFLDAAVKAPSSHNSQPWGFAVLADTHQVMISPDLQRRLPESDLTDREMYISVGAAIANFNVAAKYFGRSPQVEFVQMGNKVGAKISLTTGYEPTEEDKKMYEAINQRVNYGGDHLNKPLTTEVIMAIEQVFIGEPNINLALIRDRTTKEKIADLVEDGDKHIFNNPGFVTELVRFIRDAATKRKDGVTTTVFGIPKGPRRAAARMLLAFKKSIIENIARMDKEKVKAATAIGVITAKDESPELWLRIGELYELASLAATAHGVYFGVRAGLIESDVLHTQLENVVGKEGQRAEMLFQLGYPAKEKLKHTPRFAAAERMEEEINGEKRVPRADRPTLFKFSEESDLEEIINNLQPEQVENIAYSEHHLPELFAALHPELDPSTLTYLEQMTRFIDSRNNVTDGIWVYYPNTRRLVHVLKEEEFYLVRSASNRYLISQEGQARIRNYRYGIAGLSSGAEIAWSLVLSGAKYLRLADFDYLSGPNHNRVKGETGESKIWNLAWALWEHDPFLDLELFSEGIAESNVSKFCQGLDLLVDQTDTESKLRLRMNAQSPILMITALPNPVVEVEFPGDPMFGGRAEAAGITLELMKNIGSIGESTAYVAAMIGPNNLTIGNLRNFIAIVNGEAYTYTQTGPDVLSSAGIAGRLVRALAENGKEGLGETRSWIVDTLPPIIEDKTEQQELLQNFIEIYERRFGETQVVKYLQLFLLT
ncbi:MAG: ThiF family adenylyltransferase [Patescibacteria group bacterium]